MKRTPLRKVSLKQAARLRQYSKLRLAFLESYWVCQRCGDDSAVDVHHKEGRGLNLLNIKTWLSVCRRCHAWIHDNPRQAREFGLLK